MARRPCYQCDDDLEEITDRRNAEIRAWGRQVLADADVAAGLALADNSQLSDWDQLDASEPAQIQPEPAQPEPEITLPEPDPAPSPEPVIEPLTETPKAPAKAKGTKPTP